MDEKRQPGFSDSLFPCEELADIARDLVLNSIKLSLSLGDEGKRPPNVARKRERGDCVAVLAFLGFELQAFLRSFVHRRTSPTVA